ncbi:MAG TPA: nucleoside monophosphate kinase [Bacteroidales bacterium]|nr:nucleoside monophosphate kinase [Bacteroidales bacterium]
MIVVVISGAPGSGKTTQAEKLVKELGLYHVSTGILLRNEISADTPLGRLAKELISDGNFIPDELACEMVLNVILANSDSKGFVFDGFPRTLAQCNEFYKILADFDSEVDSFIELEVPESELVRRLQKRSKVSERSDDSDINIIKHRFTLYNDLSVSINELFILNGVYDRANGNMPIDEVFTEVVSILEDKLKFEYGNI